MVISQAPDNNTLVSLVILPSSGGNRRDVERTSTELVALIRQLSQNSSSASNALLQLLMPESVWRSTKKNILNVLVQQYDDNENNNTTNNNDANKNKNCNYYHDHY